MTFSIHGRKFDINFVILSWLWASQFTFKRDFRPNWGSGNVGVKYRIKPLKTCILCPSYQCDRIVALSFPLKISLLTTVDHPVNQEHKMVPWRFVWALGT